MTKKRKKLAKKKKKCYNAHNVKNSVVDNDHTFLQRIILFIEKKTR